MYNQLSSLYMKDGVLCRNIEPVGSRPAYLQQLLVTQLITYLHNSVTGHLDTYETLLKFDRITFSPVSYQTSNVKSSSARNVRNAPAIYRSIDIPSLVGKLVTFSIILVDFFGTIAYFQRMSLHLFDW